MTVAYDLVYEMEEKGSKTHSVRRTDIECNNRSPEFLNFNKLLEPELVEIRKHLDLGLFRDAGRITQWKELLQKVALGKEVLNDTSFLKSSFFRPILLYLQAKFEYLIWSMDGSDEDTTLPPVSSDSPQHSPQGTPLDSSHRSLSSSSHLRQENLQLLTILHSLLTSRPTSLTPSYTDQPEQIADNALLLSHNGDTDPTEKYHSSIFDEADDEILARSLIRCRSVCDLVGAEGCILDVIHFFDRILSVLSCSNALVRSAARSLFDHLLKVPSVQSQIPKAVTLLERIQYSNPLEADQFILGLVPSSPDESVKEFVKSIIALISVHRQGLIITTLKLLTCFIGNCPITIRLMLIEADLIPHLLTSLTPLSLSIADHIDVHTNLLTILNYSIWLSTVDGLDSLKIRNSHEQQTLHETVLKQVIVPSEGYIRHLCVNRHSLVNEFHSLQFMRLLGRLVLLCPNYDPTLDFVMKLPVITAITSGMSFYSVDMTPTLSPPRMTRPTVTTRPDTPSSAGIAPPSTANSANPSPLSSSHHPHYPKPPPPLLPDEAGNKTGVSALLLRWEGQEVDPRGSVTFAKELAGHPVNILGTQRRENAPLRVAEACHFNNPFDYLLNGVKFSYNAVRQARCSDFLFLIWVSVCKHQHVLSPMSNSPENTLDISQDSVQVPLFLTTPTAQGHSLNTEALRKAQDVLTQLIELLRGVRDSRPFIGKLVPPPNNNADGFTEAILTLLTSGHQEIVRLPLQLFQSCVSRSKLELRFSFISSGFFTRLTLSPQWIETNLTAHSIGQTEHDLDNISHSSNLSTESLRQIVLERVVQPVGPYISYCCQNRQIIQDDSIQQSLLTDVLIFFLKLASFTITRSLLSFEQNYSTLLCQEKLLHHVQQHNQGDLLVRSRGKADLRRLNEEGLAGQLETFGFWVDFTSMDTKQIRKDNASLMALLGANIPPFKRNHQQLYINRIHRPL
ncbi:hypothetical protein BLNAU_5528 [Blattamonas nauphoetae]|uniref:Uncharacterized protein n=1 Tax=Blattamonas nauphoetae TaxID=2049346 RepID=A0ABQ9Y703_9EUKA|nr:hypothetical protein BLNAU_5528 [Blattamonas nauphoetae]